MVNKCNVNGCRTNWQRHDAGAVFALPKSELKSEWIKFLNRKDADMLKTIFICEKHFEEKFLKRNENRVRLIITINPVPTILSESQKSNIPLSLQRTIIKPRKRPTTRVLQEDQFDQFKLTDTITNFSDVNESLLKNLPSNFSFSKYEDYAVFYKMEKSHQSVPNVTECIRINSDLRVQLFYKGSPIPLPTWFRQGRHTKFTRISMLENFSSHIQQESEKSSSLLDELKNLQFQKSPIYSSNLLRLSLLLRYSSLPAYKMLMNEFKLPSLSLLKKLTTGRIDTMKAAKALKNNGNISEDVIVIFDEMYVQKCEEYTGGETIGADEDGELYKGIICFMIVGMKSNVPFIIKTIPEKEINGAWLKDEILHCLEMLFENGFNVRGIACDNHPSNVSAYKKLFSSHGNSEDNLFITLNGKKIYLFFDTVHLMKNIRNNLLNRKRFLFPQFSFHGLYDSVNVSGGEISWRMLHEVYEKDQNLQANLKTAPKLNASVLHPGNCKQSVPVALAIFHPTTSAAIKRYFPERSDAAEFLNLIYVWWTISNSKQCDNNSHHLGDAAIPGDMKPQFLRAFTDWIEVWDNAKIPSAEKFTLSAQTSFALRQTLRCHAALLEDFFTEVYNFVLTARFQSDPLERRYGQYRQMSGEGSLFPAKMLYIQKKF